MTDETRDSHLDIVAERLQTTAMRAFSVSFWILVIALPIGMVVGFIPSNASTAFWGFFAGAVWIAAPILILVIGGIALIGAMLITIVTVILVSIGYGMTNRH